MSVPLPMSVPYRSILTTGLIASLSLGLTNTNTNDQRNSNTEQPINAVAADHLTDPETAPLNIPEPIQPPDNVSFLFGLKAGGYQIYRCEADTKGNYSWALKAPDAALYDKQGNPFGSHHAGPAWQANDGSHIVGQLEAKMVSPNDMNSVAWLLVKVVDRGGEGIFDNVTYVNRINTEGGHAPQDTCNQIHLGDEYRARYSTVYYFYGQP